MTYNQTLKATKEIREAILNLREKDQELAVNYKGKNYTIRCYYVSDRTQEVNLSMRLEDGVGLESMNICDQKPIKTSFRLYSYDMMSNPTESIIKLVDLSLGHLPEKEDQD